MTEYDDYYEMFSEESDTMDTDDLVAAVQAINDKPDFEVSNRDRAQRAAYTNELIDRDVIGGE